MRVLMLRPRMDVAFKEGPIPNERGYIPPIRHHWIRFIDQVVSEHRRRGDPVEDREKPLWQFSPDEINGDAFDLVYVPHREHETFPMLDSRVKARYYMQSVIPERFYCDNAGWAGGVEMYPCFDLITRGKTLLENKDPLSLANIGKLLNRMRNNESKFSQPNILHKLDLPKDYIFFPCQLPHDVTIKYHSNWSVGRAMTEVIESAARVGIQVVIKGHPINPGSMTELKEIAHKYGHIIWIDDASVHQLISKARLVACVNSGVGFEALIHGKPVITFGRSDYDVITMNVNRDCANEDLVSDKLDSWLMEPQMVDEKMRMEFLAGWCNWTYDSSNTECFIEPRI